MSVSTTRRDQLLLVLKKVCGLIYEGDLNSLKSELLKKSKAWAEMRNAMDKIKSIRQRMEPLLEEWESAKKNVPNRLKDMLPSPPSIRDDNEMDIRKTEIVIDDDNNIKIGWDLERSYNPSVLIEMPLPVPKILIAIYNRAVSEIQLCTTEKAIIEIIKQAATSAELSLAKSPKKTAADKIRKK